MFVGVGLPKSNKSKKGGGGPSFGHFVIISILNPRFHDTKVTKVLYVSPNTNGIIILSANFFFLLAYAWSYIDSLIFCVTKLLIVRSVIKERKRIFYILSVNLDMSNCF